MAPPTGTVICDITLYRTDTTLARVGWAGEETNGRSLILISGDNTTSRGSYHREGVMPQGGGHTTSRGSYHREGVIPQGGGHNACGMGDECMAVESDLILLLNLLNLY